MTNNVDGELELTIEERNRKFSKLVGQADSIIYL